MGRRGAAELRRRPLTGIHYLAAALLAVTAALQFNDPDPVYWVAVYGLAAAVPVVHALGRRAPFLAALTIGMAVSGLIYAAPGFFDYLASGEYGSITGSMEGPDAFVEPAREFLGLALTLAVVLCYVWRWRTN